MYYMLPKEWHCYKVVYRPKFRRFRSWPYSRKNKILELGIFFVLSHDCGQHRQKFYSRIFIFEV